MVELEIIEEYYQINVKRYRIRVKGSKIIFNVTAESEHEAIDKARRMWERLSHKPSRP